MRSGDHCIRYGGDELLIILPVQSSAVQSSPEYNGPLPTTIGAELTDWPFR